MRAIDIQSRAILLTVGLILALFGTALAQSDDPSESDPFVLTDEQDRFLLGRHLEILEDPGGELTIDDVTSPEFETRFVPSQVDVPIFGFTESAYWVRLPLRNESRLTDRWLLELGFANMQYVDLYTPRSGGNGFDVKQTGTLRPPASRDLREPRIVFDLMVPADDELTYYLRLKSGASMTFPLTAWMPDAFFTQSKVEHALAGIYFGALFVLLAYNLFLLVSLREKSYLYLLMLLASMIIFEATYTGYTDTYVFPALYFLNSYTLKTSFALLFVSMLLFADTFLELKTHLPKLHWLSIILVAVWGVLLLLAPVTTYHDNVMLVVPLALASMATVLIVGTVAGRQGIPSSRFFMIAWSGLVLGLVIVVLVRVGIMPSNLFSEKAYRLGLLWLGICWSLALADRVNMLQANVLRNERRLSQILEGLPLGVVMYEKDQRPSYINQRVNEILSNPAREIRPDATAGRTLAQTMEYFSFRVAGSERQYALEEMPIFRALRGEPATADDIEADLVDRRVPLEIWASPVKDADGAVEAAIVAFQDITRRKQTETELAAYRDNLELLVEERTAQLSELNQLLNHEISERKLLADTQVKLIRWLSAINRSHQLLRGSADLPQVHEQLLLEISQLLGAKHVFLGLCSGGTRSHRLAHVSALQQLVCAGAKSPDRV